MIFSFFSNRILLLFLFLGSINLSLAQKDPAALKQSKGNGRIIGSVIDSLSQKPIEFANVALVDPITNNPIDGTVCNDKGHFSFQKISPGNYRVLITFIGFSIKKINVDISSKKSEINLGTIILGPSVKLLQEVTVMGQKELMEEKVDRTVYHAENDLTTKGGDASDVLKRVPMLTVDMDGNVSLRGSQSIKVLINNKPSTITSSSVADALKSIPADMIKSVEVITSPSSKYDAEGSAGIINIILKKNTLEGIFFTVDGSAGSRGSNVSVNGNYKKGKMGFSLGAFTRDIYNVRGSFSNQQITRNNGDTLRNVQGAKTHSAGTNSQYTLGWDYDINKYNSLTASARYGMRGQNSYQDNLLTQTYYPDNSLKNSTLQNVKTTNVGDNIDASLNYTKTFAKKDKEISLLAIYSKSNQTNGFVFNTLSESDNHVLSRYKNVNPGYTREITFQEDFQEPLKENQLFNFGTKQIFRTVSSDYNYFTADGENGSYAPSQNSSLSNGFNYKQSISSAYASYTLTTEAGYTFKGGARYEYTHLQAHFIGKPDINIPSYGVLVPSINLSKKLKNGNLIKASYNRRIQRPSLQNLNPNLQSTSRINATMGNPYLKPEYADNYELAYKTFIKNSSINFSTFIRDNTNDIQQARSIRNDTIIAIFQNIGKETNYGLSIFASVAVSDHFSLNGGTDMFYRVLINNSNDPYINGTNRGFVKNFRLSGNYNFQKGWTLQFFSFFQGRNINLQGYRTNPINHSLSIKKDIMKNNGALILGADNFFTPSYKVYSKLNSAYISQTSTNTLNNFIIRLNFSYKIGKLQENRKRTAQEEDSNN